MLSPSPDLPDRRPLAGQLVVFTGKLSSLGRKDARALVARLGGATADDVNAKTTLLVIGAEGFGSPPQADASGVSLPGPEPGLGAAGRTTDARTSRDTSNKLKRALELNAQEGIAIRIVNEDEFCRMAGVPTPEAL